MSGRTVAAAVVGSSLLVAVCGGLTAIVGATAAATCQPSTATPTTPRASTPPPRHPVPAETVAPVGRWSSEQVGNAATIITVGVERGAPARGWLVAVATAMQESSLRNLPGGDRDSVGLFQQRPSQGWGTPAQLQDPTYAAARFYDALLTVEGWHTLPVTVAAQAVQRSAYPDAYAKWETEAATLIHTITGVDAAPACTTVVSGYGWTRPVDAAVGSGFRTVERPGHDGVDLSVPKGTPVRAAAGGTVVRVRCNAVDVRTGQPWGCDRDGHPVHTRGCGFYVDISHPGKIITRYCHLVARPVVAEGQPVAVGAVIGHVGSSGRSSGPHLHFEVHRVIGAAGAEGGGEPVPVDPVVFMASVGAPLTQSAQQHR